VCSGSALAKTKTNEKSGGLLHWMRVLAMLLHVSSMLEFRGLLPHSALLSSAALSALPPNYFVLGYERWI